jgi:hypothetical protein
MVGGDPSAQVLEIGPGHPALALGA